MERVTGLGPLGTDGTGQGSPPIEFVGLSRALCQGGRILVDASPLPTYTGDR